MNIFCARQFRNKTQKTLNNTVEGAHNSYFSSNSSILSVLSVYCSEYGQRCIQNSEMDYTSSKSIIMTANRYFAIRNCVTVLENIWEEVPQACTLSSAILPFVFAYWIWCKQCLQSFLPSNKLCASLQLRSILYLICVN